MTSESAVRLDLAHAGPFTVGDLRVEPSLRLIQNADTSVIIEPRVMQLLVALADARGRILSRDDLIERCWGGRIVGENAIHRAVSQLRKIAATTAHRSFEIETVKGVGYRLRTNGDVSAPGDREPGLLRAAPGHLSRRTVLGAIAVTAAAGSSLMLLLRKLAVQPNELALNLFARGEAIRREEGGVYAAEQAIAFYKNALREAPDFAPGWGALALGYCQLLDISLDQDTDQLAALALAAAGRSLQIDTANAYGRTAQSLVPPPYRNWNSLRPRLTALAREFPGDWLIPLQLGRLAADNGDNAAAASHFKQALEAEPLMPRAYASLFYALWSLGRLHEAEDLLEQARERWPRNWVLWNAKFHYTAFSGSAAESRAHVTDQAGMPASLALDAIDKRLKVVAAVQGGKAELAESTRAYVEEGLQRPSHVRNAATVLAGIGARDELFDLLEGYFFGRGPYATRRKRYSRRSTAFLFFPPMEKLRAEPRLRAILAEIGLPA